jgi:hypothetical protein
MLSTCQSVLPSSTKVSATPYRVINWHACNAC